MSFTTSSMGRLVPRYANRTSYIVSHHTNDFNRRQVPALASHFHSVAGGSLDQRKKERDVERRRLQALPSVAAYHTTPNPERFAAIIFTLASVSAAAMAGSYALGAVREFNAMEKRLEEEEKEKEEKEEKQDKRAKRRGSREHKDEQQQTESAGSSGEAEGKRENVFSKWFGAKVGATYYEGGFEDTMTRREAARILGVRESSPVQRIKEAHRKLLVLNHPDTGGSTYIAGKINEAKELLMKGRRDKKE